MKKHEGDLAVAQKDGPAEHRAPVARDSELTRLCAEAVGIELGRTEIGEIGLYCGLPYSWDEAGQFFIYSPLHNDAQAMALMKRLDLSALRCVPWATGMSDDKPGEWTVFHFDADQHNEDELIRNVDLNRAIVECVARLRATGLEHSAGSNDSIERR